LKQIRKRLTYANVMSSLAVFLILGGATAFAAIKKVGANEIKANSIKTGKIVKEAVTAGKIKKKAVTESKLADGAVTNSKLADGAVTTNKIADGAVTNGKIGNDAVNSAKVAPGSITRDDIAGSNLIPRAFALVDFDGEVEPAPFTSGIPNATTPVAGTYCFDLAFTPIHAQATGEADGEGNDMASVAIAGTQEGLTNCPAGTDVEVEMWDTGVDEETEEEFFLVVW
jgi:hypothetical protein